jgi:hydroxyacid-oxoacid transhydrogenase
MTCCQAYPLVPGGERVFEVDASRVKYGSGSLSEAGYEARAVGIVRVALFTDATLARLEHVATVREALREAGCDVAVYDAVRIEPTDASFADAIAFATDGGFDGYVSVGGGSVIDTCKAANLYSTHPAELLAYVNAPVGDGKPVPGPLRPHIACPTTCGTGSEVTGIAIFDLLERKVKTGIASRRLRPTLAIVDPDCTRTLPGVVVACSGFDVLSHALESYTALPFTSRAKSEAGARPMSQGANPFSDMACVEALRILGEHIVRAVEDALDGEARERMAYAATLAGIGFGNAGVHAPHAMSYAVAGLVREFRPAGYPQDEPLVPHGMAVIVNAPAAFRFTASAGPERHLHAAELLGADVRGATPDDSGEVLARRIERLMRAAGMPNGVGGVGFADADVPALAAGAFLQRRLLANAPRPLDEGDLARLFHDALRYWSPDGRLEGRSGAVSNSPRLP